MELTYNNERFEFNCTFAEKDIAKSNGFKWDMELKKWFTKDISIAEKLPIAGWFCASTNVPRGCPYRDARQRY